MLCFVISKSMEYQNAFSSNKLKIVFKQTVGTKTITMYHIKKQRERKYCGNKLFC